MMLFFFMMLFFSIELGVKHQNKICIICVNYIKLKSYPGQIILFCYISSHFLILYQRKECLVRKNINFKKNTKFVKLFHIQLYLFILISFYQSILTFIIVLFIFIHQIFFLLPSLLKMLRSRIDLQIHQFNSKFSKITYTIY